MYFSLFLLYMSGLAQCLRPNHQTVLLLENDLTPPASTIRDNLLASAIIPEVLDDFEPLYHIDVTWAKHDDEVLMGNEIKVKHVKNRPTFTIHGIEGSSPPAVELDKTYTLVLTDPDAKSRANPMWSEMCHWVMTNLTTPLPGTPRTSDLNEIAGELVEYKPPGPPPKTGAHRYVFVLLEGDTTDIKPPKERMHWGYDKVRHGVRDWAAENSLTVVGANYFYAKNKEQ